MSVIVELESGPCPMGCPEGDQAVLTGYDRLQQVPGQFAVVRCLHCGLMRTNPRPTAATIGVYYPDDYGPYLVTHVNLRQPESSLGKVVYRLKQWIAVHADLYARRLPKLKPGSLLEVGCASGAFLHKMAAEGWEVEGVEYSAAAARNAAQFGHPVHVGSLESMPERVAKFDLIVAWMVLEHLHNPLTALQQLARSAKPSASLVISIPEASAAGFRWFGERWFALHLPNHLFHFTTRTADAMLLASGWRMERVVHHCVLNNLTGSLGHVLRDWGFRKAANVMAGFATWNGGILNYVFFPIAWALARCGQTGQVTICARKA